MSKTHLFGEMDLDFSKPVDQVYREAFRISEACGYVTTYEKRTDGTQWLEFCADSDMPDAYLAITRAYYNEDKDPNKEKVNRIERVILRSLHSEDWRNPKYETVKVIPIAIA